MWGSRTWNGNNGALVQLLHAAKGQVIGMNYEPSDNIKCQNGSAKDPVISDAAYEGDYAATVAEEEHQVHC